MVELDAEYPRERARHTRAGRAALESVIARIVSDARERERSGAAPIVDVPRWSGPLASALADIGGAVVADVGEKVTLALGGIVEERAEAEEWSPEGTVAYIAAVAAGMAAGELSAAGLALAEAGRQEFLERLDEARRRLDGLAEDMVDTSVNFAAKDAGERAGARRKMWRTHSSAPRPSHSASAGYSIPMEALFANGLDFPRGPGPPAETANCKCSLVIIKEGT